MLNTAAVERAVRRIGRDIERLIATDPDHAERIRAMLPEPPAVTAVAGPDEPGPDEPAVEPPADTLDPPPAKATRAAKATKTTD